MPPSRDPDPRDHLVPANPHGQLVHDEVARVLGPWLHEDGLRVSPLGPTYSRDVDAYLRVPVADEVLRAAGWLHLDGLLARVGVQEDGRWAVVVEQRVIGAADLHLRLPPDPVAHILGRCRRLGAGRREHAELEVLRRAGGVVPSVPHPSRVRRLRERLGSVRKRLRPKMVVAVSGVDGAGKSTLVSMLTESLVLAGVPTTRIWVRPGVTSSAVDRAARSIKKILKVDREPGIRKAASGDADQVASRRGVIGALWAPVLIVNFAVVSRRRYSAAHGVVIFDRHALDAWVTWEVLYGGKGGSTVKWLIRHVLPEADLTVYLDVSASAAVHRKPDDPIGMWAVQRQLEAYRPLLEGAVLLESQQPPQRLTHEVLVLLTEGCSR